MEQQAVVIGPPSGWRRRALIGSVTWAGVVAAVAIVVAAWPVHEDAAGAGFGLDEVAAFVVWGWIVVLPFAVPGCVLEARRGRVGGVIGSALLGLAGMVTFLGGMLALGASKQTDDA